MLSVTIELLLSFFQTVMEKNNLELKVKVKGQPVPSVTWLKDEREVAPSIKIKISKSEDVHTLLIQQVTQTHNGQYKCVATNSLGKVEHVANVTVTGTRQ